MARDEVGPAGEDAAVLQGTYASHTGLIEVTHSVPGADYKCKNEVEQSGSYRPPL